MPEKHKWKFSRFGGVDQVMFRDAADLRDIENLDLKLWMALSMPLNGIYADQRTLQMLDTDNNGIIHPDEIISATKWLCKVLKNPGIVLSASGDLPLDEIADDGIKTAARRVLSNLGKTDAVSISFQDVADRAAIFSHTLFNGDGVVTEEAAGEDHEARNLIGSIISTLGGVEDRCGKSGITEEKLLEFRHQATLWIEWDKKSSDSEICPFGAAGSAAAASALAAVRTKIDDYFARCALAGFDSRSSDALNRDPADYKSLSAGCLKADSEEIASFPLAIVAPGRPLSLCDGLNPAWAARIAKFSENLLKPMFGHALSVLESDEWEKIKARFAAYDAWQAGKPNVAVAQLGAAKLTEMISGDLYGRVEKLIARDVELTPESEGLTAVEKLVRFRRDFGEILANYVNFSSFYGGKTAFFQSGTLYIDGRSCSLCVESIDDARHIKLSPLSGFFLLYCDIRRPGMPQRRIAAAVTNGSGDNLMVGRNGVFYDRNGLAWDATVSRVVSSPISVREAFWSPYKKINRMVEDMIAKRAVAADSSSTTKLAESLEKGVSQPAPQTDQTNTPIVPKKFDLGALALIGTVVGGLSALVGGFLKALFGLGWWLPLGLIGMILLVSGPSMMLAAMKLRRRNLAPLLDSNGWAINTQARINMPFGASLTRLAVLPPGTVPVFKDPFAEKRHPVRIAVELVILVALAVIWYLARLNII